MKYLSLVSILLLAGCGDEKARAEKAKQEAIEREIEARVMAKTSTAGEREAISPLRVVVYGFTAAGGLLLLHLLGAPGVRTGDAPSLDPGDRPQRSGGRVLDLNQHENPPRH